MRGVFLHTEEGLALYGSRRFIDGIRILIWVILLGFLSHAWAQEENIKFRYLTIEDGLSQSSVQCILQDHRGFIWLGTQDGLNRYDGHHFIVFHHDPRDLTTLSNSYITAIHEDRSGTLWVGTGGGLNRFDRGKEQFIRYLNDPDDPNSISSNQIHVIVEDNMGNLWIGTEGGGLTRYDYASNGFTHYRNDPADTHSLSDDYVISILEDSHGIFWVGTRFGGLNRFDRSTGRFNRYRNESRAPGGLSDNFIHCIYEDRRGVLWIGTDSSGLNRYVRSRDQFVRYYHEPNDSNSLLDNTVLTICEDKNGIIWIGTEDGLSRFDPDRQSFTNYRNDPNNHFSLNNNSVLSIYEDRSGVLWIGTRGGGINSIVSTTEGFVLYQYNPNNPDGINHNIILSFLEDRSGDLWVGTAGGLNRFLRDENRFIHYQHDPRNRQSLSNSTVWALCEDKEGQIWIGTNEGLNRFIRQENQFISYYNDENDPFSLSANFVRFIYEDRSGALWIGTEGGGLNRFDRNTDSFINYRCVPEDPNSLSSNTVLTIYEDHGGVLWIGTRHGGLNRFHRKTEKFTRYQPVVQEPQSLSDNTILSLYESKNEAGKVLWVGTPCGGLNKFDRTNDTFRIFREENGLPNDVIYGILEDSAGCLWMSTNYGISKFNPEMEVFKNYDVSDGLQSNEFNIGAYYKGADGRMYFGGINGFNVFHPDSIKESSYVSPVVITDFEIFNKSVPIGKGLDGRVILDKAISETNQITVSYSDRVLSFEFAALNYRAPEKNAYAYMMEDFEKEWNFVGNRNFVTYTNLPPGAYTFRVKGMTDGELWPTEGASLRIVVTPPIYKTWWFRMAITFTIFALAFTLYQVRTHNIRVRTRRLEEINVKLNEQISERRRIEKRIKDSLREKDVLLKEIHHRVKNNLQVICSLLNLQTHYIKGDNAMELFRESRDRIRSMALVHEKLYSSQNLSRIDFAEYIDNLTGNLYQSYGGDSKKVSLETKVKDVSLGIDRAIPCGLIINELVSNALKHAFPPTWRGEGKIEISLHEIEKGVVELVIRDNGVGIPEGFDIKNTESLGMQLVFILAEDQLGGKVDVEYSRGTSFHIRFSV